MLAVEVVVVVVAAVVLVEVMVVLAVMAVVVVVLLIVSVTHLIKCQLLVSFNKYLLFDVFEGCSTVGYVVTPYVLYTEQVGSSCVVYDLPVLKCGGPNTDRATLPLLRFSAPVLSR